MPNVAAAVRAEVLRLSARVMRQGTGNLRKDSVALKHAVAELKRQVAQLKKQLGQVLKAMPEQPAVEVTEAELKAARPTAKMVRGLRNKLGISQQEFARLVNVSGNSVNLWEHKTGRLNLRGETKKALLRVKKLGKGEVLAELKKKTQPAPKKRVPRRRRRSKK